MRLPSPAVPALSHQPTPPSAQFQIEAVSDRCVLHKSDSDLKISAEGKAR